MSDAGSAAFRVFARIGGMPVHLALAAWIAGCGAFWFFPQLPSALRWPARLLFVLLIIHAVLGIIRAVRMTKARPKRALFAFTAILLSIGIPYLCIEAACWAYLRISTGGLGPFALTEMQVNAVEAIIAGEGSYMVQDRELGWTTTPGGSLTTTSDREFLNFPATTNMQGIRADREYSITKPPGILRALCFGDSFTYCNDVSNQETWPHYAEETGGVEFLNFGVGGYGMTQALLRYLHDGRRFEADVVILGCMTNDVRRSVNAYYPFRLTNPSESGSVMGIPFASLDSSGGLVLNPNPLPDADSYRELLANPGKRLRELSKLDRLFHPPPPTPMLTLINSRMGDELAETWSDITLRLRRNLNLVLRRSSRVVKENPLDASDVFDPRNEIFKINCRVFDRFVTEVKSTGARPVILWLSGRKDFDRLKEGRGKIYQPFVDYFAGKGYDFIDTMDWIAADMPGKGGFPDNDEVFGIGHNSPATNKVIGRRIADHVRKLMSER